MCYNKDNQDPGGIFMNASFYVPTHILFGRGILQENKKAVALGRHALIVTGKHSAKASGALDEVCAVLDENAVTYTVFDRITENPPLLTCFEGGRLAAEVGADFVIGIGGGSPLDAAKAIAAFAANQGIEPMDIYDEAKRQAPTLPIVAITTTAGTGSEANYYSVLTLPCGERKKTFKAADAWPRVAIVVFRGGGPVRRKGDLGRALAAARSLLPRYAREADRSLHRRRHGHQRHGHGLPPSLGLRHYDAGRHSARQGLRCVCGRIS